MTRRASGSKNPKVARLKWLLRKDTVEEMHYPAEATDALELHYPAEATDAEELHYPVDHLDGVEADSGTTPAADGTTAYESAEPDWQALGMLWHHSPPGEPAEAVPIQDIEYPTDLVADAAPTKSVEGS